MSAAVLLVIFTTVAGGGGYMGVFKQDWRPLGTFVDMASCKEAERLLGQAERTLCLPGATPVARESGI